MPSFRPSFRLPDCKMPRCIVGTHRRWQRAAAHPHALVAAVLVLVAGAPAKAADTALIDAAKKEGEVIWYTTQIIDQLAVPMAAAFKKAYGIEVKYVRANSTDVALRISSEAQAGRINVDVFDGTSAVVSLKKQGLVLQWIPETARRLPKDYIDAEGYWIATNIYIITPGFNTELVKPGTEPKTFQDLLDPKWKGKMAWGSSSSSSAGPGFIGNVLRDMGPDKGRAYLEKLSGQKIAGLGVSARQVLDQVIGGEYAIGLQIFNNHAVISAAKGAPSAWIAMEPATAVLSTVAATKAAPHPNAAKLFLEFLVSEEGQKIYRSADYMPIDPKVPPTDPKLLPAGGNFRASTFTPEEVEDQMPTWTKLFREIFG
jgi:ABC-type Fe3+ transport system substrate-binding protein